MLNTQVVFTDVSPVLIEASSVLDQLVALMISEPPTSTVLVY